LALRRISATGPSGVKPGDFFDRPPDDGAERQDGLVDRHEIDDVAKLAPSGGGHHLVHRQIDRMQDMGRTADP
jgi:hypothetical protein